MMFNCVGLKKKKNPCFWFFEWKMGIGEACSGTSQHAKLVSTNKLLSSWYYNCCCYLAACSQLVKLEALWMKNLYDDQLMVVDDYDPLGHPLSDHEPYSGYHPFALEPAKNHKLG
ncbi:unnamed protein product [Linum trigynum]|uniref:Uncharacterized protein n=1 Tax=Linum trigynum TaxID=586398 RepID=A0AAV2FAM0_9ROSI